MNTHEKFVGIEHFLFFVFIYYGSSISNYFLLLMNIAQNCIKAAKINTGLKAANLESKSTTTLGANETNSQTSTTQKKPFPSRPAIPKDQKKTAPNIDRNHEKPTTSPAKPKWEPSTKPWLIDCSKVVAVVHYLLPSFLVVFVFAWLMYVAITFISGGTTFANQRIKALFEASQELKSSVTPVAAPVAAVPESSAEQTKTVESSPNKTDLQSGSKNMAPVVLEAGAPLPSGVLPNIGTKYVAPLDPPANTQRVARRKPAEDTQDDEAADSSSKIRLLNPEKTSKAPAVALLPSPAPSASPQFEVVTLTKQSVVIKTDQGTRQVAIGQVLPDGKMVESIDAKLNTYTSNGSKIQIQ